MPQQSIEQDQETKKSRSPFYKLSPLKVRCLCYSALVGFGVAVEFALMGNPAAQLAFAMVFAVAMLLSFVNSFLYSKDNKQKNADASEKIANTTAPAEAQKPEPANSIVKNQDGDTKADENSLTETNKKAKNYIISNSQSISNITAALCIRLAVKFCAQKPLVELLDNFMPSNSSSFVGIILNRYIGRLFDQMLRMGTKAEAFDDDTNKEDGKKLSNSLQKEVITSITWISSFFAVYMFTPLSELTGLEGLLAVSLVGATIVLMTDLLYNYVTQLLNKEENQNQFSVKENAILHAKLTLDFALSEFCDMAYFALPVADVADTGIKSLSAAGAIVMRGALEATYTQLLYYGPLDDMSEKVISCASKIGNKVKEGVIQILPKRPPTPSHSNQDH